MTPEKEENSGSSQDEYTNDMPLNLSTKRSPKTEENSNESSTPPPLRAVNLKSSPHTPYNEEDEEDEDEEEDYEPPAKRRSQGSHIWSPASMCEKSLRFSQYQEDGQEMDPIVRKFKYERRNSYTRHHQQQQQQQQLQDSNLLTPLSSISGPATFPRVSVKPNPELELAQQQIYAHRNAFMAGLAGNNLELLTQHLKAQTQRELDLLRQQRVDLFVQQSSDNDSNGGDLSVKEEYVQHHQQYVSQHHQNPHQQQQHQPQQHPDSTALIGSLTDVRMSSSSYQDSDGGGSGGAISHNGEKRAARNFQVSLAGISKDLKLLYY